MAFLKVYIPCSVCELSRVLPKTSKEPSLSRRLLGSWLGVEEMPPFSLGQEYEFQKIHEEPKGKVVLVLHSKGRYGKGLHGCKLDD